MMLPHIVLRREQDMGIKNVTEALPITNRMLLKGMPYVIIHDTGNVEDAKDKEQAKDDGQ